ncbi:MAG: 3-deoxy-D-manno-octulosonic acid transferase, partial [Proteobacteria bacterium]|nr:3-deoxy-D-manno-octulosonic acid transferase [Pseudomonadota bacterium]
GGQNPLEAARLDSALLFGPHMFNFAEQAAAMTRHGGASLVADADALAGEVALLLANADETGRRAAAAAAAADAGHDVVAAVLRDLSPLIPGLETDYAGA